MAESRNTFTDSRMNQDLDARLIQPGTYRTATNIGISRSAGDSVGSLENVLGNFKVSDFGITEENIRVISAPQIVAGVTATYIRKPRGVDNGGTTTQNVNWAYVVTNGQAMYNATDSSDFELHESEETLLVMKTLELAGVIIQKPDLIGIGQQKQQ